MEHVVNRILVIFAVGFALIGAVLGFLPIARNSYCGSLFAHEETCAGTSSRLALVVLIFGLAVTCAIAARSVPIDKTGDSEEPPTVYPGGAQV